MCLMFFFFFKQKTAYEMRISDWSSDVCSSDLDLKAYAEAPRPVKGSQDMPWDPLVDYQWMRYATDCYFSLWRSLKPVVTKVHGYAVAGGSDIALSSDIVIMAEDAKIGYPPARIWGCPTTGMRSEEHTSELQSLMRISYAVF